MSWLRGTDRGDVAADDDVDEALPSSVAYKRSADAGDDRFLSLLELRLLPLRNDVGLVNMTSRLLRRFPVFLGSVGGRSGSQ